MASDTLILRYNVKVRVKVSGLNADGTAHPPVSTITSNQPQDIVVIPTPIQDEFDVKNTSTTATTHGTNLRFSAINELGAVVIGDVSYELQPADPATHLEIKII